MKKVLFLLLIFLNLYAKEITIATYNVENLFDAKNDGTEYRDFRLSKNGWNKQKANQKLENIAFVINKLNADIIALQEVENYEITKALAKKTGYEFQVFSKPKTSPVGVALLSKFKIVDKKEYILPNIKTRSILKANVAIENKILSLIVTHFPTAKRPKKERLAVARKLKSILPKDDFVILGDFNVAYKANSLLNKMLNQTNNAKHLLDLWAEKEPQERYSHAYKGRKSALDHIIISSSFFSGDSFGYIDLSFGVFKPDFMLKNKVPKRYKNGKGYSDHLPLYFRIKPGKYTTNSTTKSIKKLDENSKNVKLIKAMPIYKNAYGYIIAQEKRGIFLYRPNFDLIIGKNYDFRVLSVKNYNGENEITALYIEKEYDKIQNPAINMLSSNELKNAKAGDVILNIKGEVKNKRLYIGKKSIKLYARKPNLMPKDGYVSLKKLRVGMYKNKLELILEERE